MERPEDQKPESSEPTAPAATEAEEVKAAEGHDTEPEKPSHDVFVEDPFCGEDSFFERTSRPRSSQWLFVWSDLMMVMFIFFLVLYIFGAAQWENTGAGSDEQAGQVGGSGGGGEGGGGGDQIREAGQPAENIPFAYRELIVDGRNIDSISSVNLAQDRAVRIVIAGDIMFPSASTELLPEASPFLDKISSLLKETPHGITVIGHTDDIPIASSRFASNWELSVLRAAAVARQLIAKSGLPPGQFQVAGQAEFHPIVPNSTPENRRRNRRVEIIVTRDLPEGGLPVGGDIMGAPKKPKSTARR